MYVNMQGGFKAPISHGHFAAGQRKRMSLGQTVDNVWSGGGEVVALGPGGGDGEV